MSTYFSLIGLKANRLHVWRALFLVLASVVSVRVVLAQEEQPVFEPRVVVVQFEPGIVIGERAAKTGLTAFDRTVARYEVEVIERAFPFLDYVEPTPKTAQNLAALRRTYYVRYRTETNPERVARALSAVRGVVYAEPVLINRVLGSASRTDSTDPFYGDQSYLRHMRLPEAWSIVRGEDGTPLVVIAIVDSGTDWGHEDLLANVWTNVDEIPDNGIDDDDNGFIDDVHGANFANGDEMDHDPKPRPRETHGTLVAGAAGAVTDNATGLAGAAWNAQLMHVNAACPLFRDLICYGYEGILYAAANGADIINASWRGFPVGYWLNLYSQVLDLATDMGALVVAATGNDDRNHDVRPSYPAAHSRVLSVGATERDSRRRAEFSQYGRMVNVFAPGVDITTTSPGNEYSFSANGTSLSSSLVSGVAALIKTRFPEMSPDVLREQLRLSSENMDAENPEYVGQLGRGYVNAEASLRAVTVPAVRVKRWSWSDSDGNGRIDSGDHVTVEATVVNYLSAARSLAVELVAVESYSFITMTAAEYQVGFLERGDSTEVTFQFEVAANAPPLVSAQFYIRIRDGAFTDVSDAFFFGINRRRLDLEHVSLSAFYVATNGDNWTNNTGWDIAMVPTDEELSRWYGVGTRQGRVIWLDLSENNLTGTLPAEWSGLSELETLELPSNSLSGPIPAELRQLSKLESLGLSSNSLSGPIPAELGQLSLLQGLSLTSNLLSGPIPVELGQLSALGSLSLTDNSLSGPIPAELGNLSKLQVLSLDHNSLSGPIPAELGNLSRLKYLMLHGNSLSGPIPAELGQLSELQWLFLYRNSLSGSIPAELGQLSKLQRLHLYENSLSGPIPAELGQLSELQWLYLNENSLTGQIPAELGQLSQLKVLSLLRNSLSGPIPAEIGQLSRLENLILPRNSLSGPIPAELGLLSQLQRLSLNINSLTGLIPAELGQLSMLEGLSLSTNSLSGPIPAELGQLSQLKWLHLDENSLSGPIPAELGQLSELELLSLEDNSLSGPIPAELGQLSQLEWLYLAENSLTGPIPAELGQLSRLGVLGLGNNSLSGPIPAELGQLSVLRTLSLRSNSLTGPIPAELGQLLRLQQLSLSGNSLSGLIPPELGQLSQLRNIWLNDNSLSGSIPAGLGQLSELKRLRLNDNSLSGSIPPELGQLSELQQLRLNDNSLSGSIPAELGQLSELQQLWLNNNSLSGLIPAELGHLSQLQQLRLSGNSLTGQLPRSFIQLASLQIFDFGGQSLCAPLDAEFQAWLRSIPDVSGPTCAAVAPVSFADRIADQFFPHGQTIDPITLPEATGGATPIVYGLTPALPAGLTFDAITRTISGTPTVVMAYTPYTYKATGAHGSADSLEFSIEVYSPPHVDNESLPEVFAIRGNYPNPFRDATRLVLDLPWSARVAVEVVDVTGRRVVTVPAVELSAGWERSLELRGVALSSGLYLYRLIATSSEGTVSTRVGRFVQIR